MALVFNRMARKALGGLAMPKKLPLIFFHHSSLDKLFNITRPLIYLLCVNLLLGPPTISFIVQYFESTIRPSPWLLGAATTKNGVAAQQKADGNGIA